MAETNKQVNDYNRMGEPFKNQFFYGLGNKRKKQR